MRNLTKKDDGEGFSKIVVAMGYTLATYKKQVIFRVIYIKFLILQYFKIHR